MIKLNPIPARWVTHKLEKNNTKELLPLLQRFWTPHQSSQSGDLTKGLGIPGDLTLKASRIFLQDFCKVGETEIPVFEGTNKILCVPRRKGKEQWPHRRLTKLPASVRRSPVKAWVSRGSPQGWGHWQLQSWKAPLGVNHLGGHHLHYHRACRLEDWVASGQKNYQVESATPPISRKLDYSFTEQGSAH